MNNLKNSVAGVTSPLWARAIKISISLKRKSYIQELNENHVS